MTTPISRFIGGYADHRYNPFTSADMAISKTEDHVAVPSSSPFCLQLLEVPRKETPSTVVVYNYTDGITMTEVVTTPTLGQYWVDYPSPAGQGTGMIAFNSGDAGKDIRVQYKATGSPVVAEFLDTFIPWPSPTPGQNQGVIFQSGVPIWAYFPKRYFHSENVIYNAADEFESQLIFDFKMGANDSKVILRLKGAKVHQAFYTELMQHTHGPGSLGTDQPGNHSHTLADHTHAATQPSHTHYYQAAVPGTSTQSGIGGADNPTIAGSGQLSSASAGNHSHGVSSGVTASQGTTPKTYPDSLKAYIDGVDKTANILALLSGWTKLGDGTNTHALVTAGTGELDITALVPAGTYHEIIVTEPVSAAGGRVLLHLEVY